MATGHKILWHSVAPWHPTGYGTQTALFTTRFAAAGHQMSLSTRHGLHGSPLEWNDFTVYPGDDHEGSRSIPALAKKLAADLIVVLQDVWVLDPEVFAPLNVACWVPVDHEPCPPKVALFFQTSGARPVAMSRFGERMLQEAGLDPLYVPHGINTKVFRPLTVDRAGMRKALGLDPDAFLVGMVGNNSGNMPSRKGFPEALRAFAEFQRNHPEAVLYLHTDVTGAFAGNHPGYDLRFLCYLFGIPPGSVAWVSQSALGLGEITDVQLAQVYGAMDVLLNPSYGEGFGIPIVEAQACGTPVIVSDWTAMTELCGAGWLVAGEPQMDYGHHAYFLHPFVSSIVAALEQAYEARGDQEIRARAREFALGYDADVVMRDYWAPALETLVGPREVPPLPNRAMRRAAAKATA